jgi:hypothetical protein
VVPIKRFGATLGPRGTPEVDRSELSISALARRDRSLEVTGVVVVLRRSFQLYPINTTLLLVSGTPNKQKFLQQKIIKH